MPHAPAAQEQDAKVRLEKKFGGVVTNSDPGPGRFRRSDSEVQKYIIKLRTRTRFRFHTAHGSPDR